MDNPAWSANEANLRERFMSRQDWPEKGNNMLAYAFQKYLKRQPKALLLLTEWGQHEIVEGRSYVDMMKDLI